MSVRDYSYEMKEAGVTVRAGWIHDDLKNMEVTMVPPIVDLNESKAFFDLVVRIGGFMRASGITNIRIHKE